MFVNINRRKFYVISGAKYLIVLKPITLFQDIRSKKKGIYVEGQNIIKMKLHFIVVKQSNNILHILGLFSANIINTHIRTIQLVKQ